ncbi:MAG: hypothetical protein MN733_07310 [Nitrososphaera sp.]|nr:hypothetical protein [Nitrososphaera sp.]
MAQSCKHENAEAGKHCPDCGELVKSKLRLLAEEIADVLEERSKQPKKKSKSNNEERTLADEIGLD